MNELSFLQLLFDQTWQIALLALMVAVVVRLLSSRHGRLTYWLWLLVVIKCVTPPIWGHSLALFSQIQTVLGSPILGSSVVGESDLTFDSSSSSAVIDGRFEFVPTEPLGEAELVAEHSSMGDLLSESSASESSQLVDRQAPELSGCSCEWCFGYW